MGNKLTPIEREGAIVAYAFLCPGCENYHAPYVRPHKAHNGASWEFNGDVERPTFMPSILQRLDFTDPDKAPQICHSFVVNGNIQFLADCTHKLAGQTIELLDVPTEDSEAMAE